VASSVVCFLVVVFPGTYIHHVVSANVINTPQSAQFVSISTNTKYPINLLDFIAEA